MVDIKQVIVVRKDLNMRKGKIAAQCAHASMAAVLSPDNYIMDENLYSGSDYHFEENMINGKVAERFLITHMIDEYLKEWLQTSFTKIVVGCNSEDELIQLRDEVAELNIRHSLIKDSGKTEFDGIPTLTCLGIGPYPSSEIDKITSHLKLL